MATLVLTAVGTAVGGPLGGAIGAMLGGAVDRAVLFRPKGREGPRLTELAVQTSSYGSAIPQLFGTIRVAGTVVWATDLIETRSTEGGGKRGPQTTSYAYAASFAVLLSARAIRGVGRIWSDGKLLRGADGALTAAGMLRLHTGSEAQDVDPLIASAEGAGLAPAHRGCAYAVFEGLALADFGNRIPSLTFEVIADEGPVTLGAIAEAVSGGVVAADGAMPAVIGYSAYGARLRDVIEGLAEAGSGWIADAGASLTLAAGEGAAAALADTGADPSRGAARTGERTIAPADSAPASLSVAYYDVARDYQSGLQRAERPGAGIRHQQVELPAVLDAGAARGIAQAMLLRADVQRERRRLTCDWRSIGVRAGDRVTIAGEPGVWRVAGWTLEAMVLTLDLVRIVDAPLAGPTAPGRAVTAPDRPHGATIVHAFEIAAIDEAPATKPRLTVAAAGVLPGWRSAALSLSSDGGDRWTPAGAIRLPAVVGTIVVPPRAAPSTLADRAGTIEVELAHDDMALGDADAAALDAGANLALAGDELVQFERAEPIGPARWRLSGLWRGRRGTESAAGTQVSGDRFVLLERAALVTIDLPVDAIGRTMRVMAAGIGDGDAPPVCDVVVTGASVRPPSPVHLRAHRNAAGDVTATWVRRSRAGWAWGATDEVPLGEEREAYRVAIAASVIEANVPGTSIDATTAAGATTVSVVQLGTLAASEAGTTSIA